MGEAREHVCLAAKAFPRRGVAQRALGEQLDRDFAIEVGVVSAPDLTHPSRAERREEAVPAECGAGDKTHRRRWGRVEPTRGLRRVIHARARSPGTQGRAALSPPRS